MPATTLVVVGTPGDDRLIELSVRRVGGSLHGCARDRAGQSREFTGMLGLLGALEALLDDPETAPSTVMTSEDT